MKNLQHEYFPHDYNPTGDPNITKLLRCHGNLGYGIFWRIVERLYQAEGLHEADYDLISYAIQDDDKKIKSIVEDFGLFYRKGKHFGSHSVDRRLEKRRDKSEKSKRAANARHASAEHPQSDSNAKKKEEKEKKERKHIETGRFAPPTIEDVRSYCMERKNRVDPDRWLSHYEANGWKVGKNPMKDWRAAVRTWEHDGAEPKGQIEKIAKTCESEKCPIFTGGVRPKGMTFPKDCDRCEAATRAS